MAKPNPTVFVIDDDVSVREALQALITCEGWRAETFASASDFLSRPGFTGPGCLVLDVTLPDLDGLELQSRVIAERSDLPIIFITAYGDVATTVKAMKAGAFEFLTKPLDEGTVLQTIRDAIERSKSTLDSGAALKALQERYDELSPREREVMGLVVSGLMNKQVGGELGISEITVKAHRGRVMRKMNAGSFAELVNMDARLRDAR